MFKRYSYAGGTTDPLVISWPAGIKAGGEENNQYHHVTDIVPTLLDSCGVQIPSTLKGDDQFPLPGVSMRYSFDNAEAPTEKKIQYYAMLGTRGIWQDGWKAAPSMDHSNMVISTKTIWELYHVDADRSEAKTSPGRTRRSCSN